MTLNDLLTAVSIPPEQVLVLRHRPKEPQLNKVLPWLAAEKPEVFNAYQQTQSEKLERVMSKMVGKGYIASFIGRKAGKALFIGLYQITAAHPLTFEQFWAVPAYQEMKTFGMKGWAADEATFRQSVLWFDLTPLPQYADWKGKLIVGWPPPERSWWRRAHRNTMPLLAVREDSALDAAMPSRDELTLTWEELSVLPERWKNVIGQWRGVYYIYDTSDGKGYVGSAAGAENLLGRWLGYAVSGHGGNALLRGRDPKAFRFTILQRVSPDMDVADVSRLESTWKVRLHTRHPNGLNDN